MCKAYEYLSLSYSIALSYKGSNTAAILQQILKYLIIARIYHGQMPREEFLRRVCLEEYIALVNSVQEVCGSGNLGRFGRL